MSDNSDDRRVNKRSDRQVRDAASRTKLDYGVSKLRPVNIVRCLQSGNILTDQGRKKLIYKVIPDKEMGRADGKTEFSDGVVTISVKQSVHDLAVFGDGRARMTLAHELAHGVMHYGASKFRLAGAVGTTGYSKTNSFESAEHQAKVFAAAFLIHDEQAAEFETAEEISAQFGVSLQAGQIAFERLSDEKKRAKSVERVMRMNLEIQERLSPSKAALKPKYLSEPCIGCGQQTVLLIGMKLLCECGRLTDRPQDGDR